MVFVSLFVSSSSMYNNATLQRPWLQSLPLQAINPRQFQQFGLIHQFPQSARPFRMAIPHQPSPSAAQGLPVITNASNINIGPMLSKHPPQKENQAPPCSRFSKEETKLLVNLWEDEFEAFLNKKRVKQEDWDALTEMYNNHAAILKFARRTSTQIENKIKNLKDGYKKISDSLKTTGSGFNRDKILQDFPFWMTFDRLFRDRDSFNPKHILDPQKAHNVCNVQAPDEEVPDVEEPDQFEGIDEVSEDDTLAVAAAKRQINFTGKSPSSSSTGPKTGSKRKASEDSPPSSASSSGKRKAQGKKVTVKELQEQEKDADDRVLQFLVESREKDQEIFGKMMQFAEQADKRNADITLKFMETLGNLFSKKN